MSSSDNQERAEARQEIADRFPLDIAYRMNLGDLIVVGARADNGWLVARCTKCSRIRAVHNDDGHAVAENGAFALFINPACKSCEPGERAGRL